MCDDGVSRPDKFGVAETKPNRSTWRFRLFFAFTSAADGTVVKHRISFDLVRRFVQIVARRRHTEISGRCGTFTDSFETFQIVADISHAAIIVQTKTQAFLCCRRIEFVRAGGFH